MLDAYVCAGCPGAADTNPGTQANPVATIGQGIRNAQTAGLPTVFVATTYMGTPMTYSEDVTMVQGISVQGRWAVTPAGPTLAWNRTAARGALTNTQATGVKFPSGITRATVWEGIAIRQASISGMRVAGVTITTSSPLLRDFDVLPVTASTTQPQENVGIDVIGAVMSTTNPRFEGGSSSASTVTAGAALTTSTGIAASRAVVETQNVTVSGGQAGTASRGGYLGDSPGAQLRNSRFSGGAAPTCMGVFSQGPASGTLLDNVTATGCPRPDASTMVVSRQAWGVVFDACGGASGIAPPTVRQSTVNGGVVGGTGSVAVGGGALDNCPVRFESSMFTGATGNPPSGPSAETSTGVACSFRGMRTAAGGDSRCAVVSNTITGGFVQTARSVGLACDGSCGASGAACQGSCGEVLTNSMTASTGANLTHLLISNSSPNVQRNNIGFGGNGTFCPAGATAVGVDIVGSAAQLVNNIVLGGPCFSATGINHTLIARTDMSVPSPTFHSNTIVATSGVSMSPLNGTSVGVQLNGAPGSIAALRGGTWRNNIITAGPVAGASSTLAGFREAGTSADPLELSNNLFFVVTLSMNPPLYINEGLSVLTTPTAINNLMDTTASGNIGGNPQFLAPASGDFHIGSMSPARGAGTSTGAPTVDIDNQARPNPNGTQPDIGADEIP